MVFPSLRPHFPPMVNFNFSEWEECVNLASAGCSDELLVQIRLLVPDHGGLAWPAGSDIGLELTDLYGAVIQTGSSRLLILLHLYWDVVGAGRAEGQLRGLSHALNTAVLLGCHNLLEAHGLGLTGWQFLEGETGLGSSRRV